MSVIKDKLNIQTAKPCHNIKTKQPKAGLDTSRPVCMYPMRLGVSISLVLGYRHQISADGCLMSPDSPDVPDVSLTNIRAASTLPDQLIARVIPRVRLNVSIIR